MKYQVAKNEFLSLGRVKYDKKNDDHETKLLKLWKVLKPEKELSAR